MNPRDYLDQYSNFADSRDGSLDIARRSVYDAYGVKLMPSVSVPQGQLLDSTRLSPLSGGLTASMTPNEARRVPSAVSNGGIYADMVQLLVPLAIGEETLALPRPGNTRVLLCVQNTNASNLFVAFDQIANTSGLLIPPGGNIFFDAAVPQNDLHIVYGAAVATVVPIFYMNADILRPVP
jgi:hypothetical protein